MRFSARMAAPVLLGLRDAPVPPGGLPFRGALSSKLGGRPDGAPPEPPTCPLCSAALAHVAQLYCPLEGSRFHRRLGVFACAARACRGRPGSWKVLRSQYLHVPGKETPGCPWKQQERTAEAAAWCDGADDWGGDGEAASSDLSVASVTLPRDRPCAAQFQRLSLEESAGVSQPSDAHQPAEEAKPHAVPEFPSYYISVVAEEDYLGGDVDHAQKLLIEYQQREDVDLKQLMSASCPADGEKYEKNEAKARDRVFHKFMKRISVCPEQIIRYSWGGQPLFISNPSAEVTAAVPPCPNCQSERIFEFQLMPAMVNMLKIAENAETLIEFGTALVFTCGKSCWSTSNSAPLEEYIFVQEDPDQQMFK